MPKPLLSLALNCKTYIVVLLAVLLHRASGQETKPEADVRVRQLKEFIQSAPKAAERFDRTFAIKIPMKDRREAVRRCDEIIAAEPTNIAARELREKLTLGEGRYTVIAGVRETYGDHQGFRIPPEYLRLERILRENFIDSNCNATRGWVVNVAQSHAARATFLLATLIQKEGLKDVTLLGPNGKLKLEDALKADGE